MAKLKRQTVQENSPLFSNLGTVESEWVGWHQVLVLSRASSSLLVFHWPPTTPPLDFVKPFTSGKAIMLRCFRRCVMFQNKPIHVLYPTRRRRMIYSLLLRVCSSPALQ